MSFNALRPIRFHLPDDFANERTFGQCESPIVPAFHDLTMFFQAALPQGSVFLLEEGPNTGQATVALRFLLEGRRQERNVSIRSSTRATVERGKSGTLSRLGEQSKSLLPTPPRLA
jgi:hypothetical protein